MIERITAAQGFSIANAGRHRWSGATATTAAQEDETGLEAAYVEFDLESPTIDMRTMQPTGRRRFPVGQFSRRIAPIAVGGAVMLVAATVVTMVNTTSGTSSAIPRPGTSILAAQPTTVAESTPTGTAAPEPTTPAAKTPAQTAARTATPKATTGPASSEATAVPTPKPAPTSRTAPARSDGDGTQAAAAGGWTPAGGDEFNGSMSSNWTPYEGAGHAGNGRRTADALSVENGSLVIRGGADGTTGGMAWGANQRFGKWEMRARFAAGDAQYHPVLLLWPNGAWPQGGEVDFAETDSAAGGLSFFLHYSSSNQQKSAKKTLDITQWHNYAVEWVDGRITGYIDGDRWFESTDGATMPPGEMHPVIQLDYFPDGGSPRPTEMFVDYMRIYK